jgi:hypothetical protein
MKLSSKLSVQIDRLWSNPVARNNVPWAAVGTKVFRYLKIGTTNVAKQWVYHCMITEGTVSLTN